MSLPQYVDAYNNFDLAALEAEVLDGRLDSGQIGRASCRERVYSRV